MSYLFTVSVSDMPAWNVSLLIPKHNYHPYNREECSQEAADSLWSRLFFAAGGVPENIQPKGLLFYKQCQKNLHVHSLNSRIHK